ncbi:Paraneoplastic antigen Ma1 [Merluccius polli]|uniref:Paraneoplastic antigen Ma1 n=1 Tax=Merluccius polli TaxID=89951 RepID=A0AA47MGQ9_MERPO|nr:Paraneoplastic antigen Ma1 [Merluccius polli]
MEVVETENVKVLNSVIVSGLTDTGEDQDVTDFLKQYGRIASILRVDEPESPYHKNAIVEYETGDALKALELKLPYDYMSPNEVTYEIRALVSEYVPTVADSATESYFTELRRIAKLSGRTFEDVLRLQLIRSPKLAQSPLPQLQEPSPATTTVPAEMSKHSTGTGRVHSQIKENEAPITTVSFANPAEVQRVIVEHVVKNEAPASHASYRLRQFSGKTPCPSHEVDFDTWRNSVELILKDPALSDLQRSRRILESLVPPAAHVVKPTQHSESSSSQHIPVVFLNTFQNTGETPSQFLHRLQTILTKVLKRGGLSANEADRHLLRQFCRGCWDNVLIADLQLERKRDNPPPFTELLLQLRIEEDRQAAKENRMKNHLGASKQRANVHLLAASSLDTDTLADSDITELRKQITQLHSQLTRQKSKKAESKASPREDEVDRLRKEVTELKSQLTSRKPQNFTKTKANVSQHSAKCQTKTQASVCHATSNPVPTNRPKPWYCFRCGEDGHIAPTCNNEPDLALVAEKKIQLREKQSLWDDQNGSSSPQRLN